MATEAALSSTEILAVAQELGVSCASLQAQLRLAEGEGELDEEPTLNALRVLLTILEKAEGRG
jgi:hypothetical protein